MSSDAGDSNGTVHYSPLLSSSSADQVSRPGGTPLATATIPNFDRSILPSWGPRPGEVTQASLSEGCFGTNADLPAWLIQPAATLEAVAQRRRPLAARLTDLARMVDQIDDLYAVHLASNPAAQALRESLPRWTRHLFDEAHHVLRRQLLPDLAEQGAVIQPVANLDEWQRTWLQRYFMQRIYPLLTPLAIDPGHPFPFISNDSLNLLVEVRQLDGQTQGQWSERRNLFARVKIPHTAPRLIAVPHQPAARWGETSTRADTATVHVWTADLVRYHIHHLFAGMPVRHVYLFRVVRGEAPLPGTPEIVRPRVMLARHRRQEDRPVVRLDVEQRMDEPTLAWLTDHLRLPYYAVARHENLLEWLCLPHLYECLAHQR